MGGEASVHNKSKGSQQRSFEAVGECQRLRTKRLGILKQTDADKIELEEKLVWYTFKRYRPPPGWEGANNNSTTSVPQEVDIEAEFDDENWDFAKADEHTKEWGKVVIGEEEFFFPHADVPT